MNSIFQRTSVRSFTSQKVSEEQIDKLIKAGMQAPSANNEKPWHFIVVTDPTILEKIPHVHPYAKMAAESAGTICVCGDPLLEISKGYWVQDCSASIQNILLQAVEMGLGAVWCGVYPRENRMEAVRGLLDIPDNILPLALIPFGYPAVEPTPKNHFNPDRIHKNKW